MNDCSVRTVLLRGTDQSEQALAPVTTALSDCCSFCTVFYLLIYIKAVRKENGAYIHAIYRELSVRTVHGNKNRRTYERKNH